MFRLRMRRKASTATSFASEDIWRAPASSSRPTIQRSAMPTETKIAARRSDGAELYYQQATLPSREVVETYERFHPGAAAELLNMAKREQDLELGVRDRDSRLEFVTRIIGMCFAFVLTLVMIGGGIMLICREHTASGCITLFTALIGVIGCLATGGKRVS